MARALFGWVLLACWAIASPALAQPDVEQPSDAEAAAQAAFDEGMRLMEAGHYEQACERIAKSLELDPGMAAQFRLAQCYEKLGRAASAWKNYQSVAQAARAAGMRERERLANERASALQGQLSTLTIDVPESVRNAPGVRIERDGERVSPDLWGTAMPVDPVTVTIVVSASGREPWSTEVAIRGMRARERVDVPEFEGSGPIGGGDTADSGMSGQAIAGIVIAAVGAAAMGAGVIIGVAAKPRYDESNDHCVDNICDAEGVDIREDVRTQGNIATAVFVIGSAALVGGAVLWITAPSGGDSDAGDSDAGDGDFAMRFGVSPTGLVLGGTW